MWRSREVATLTPTCRDAYAGGGGVGGAASPLPSFMGAGGARIALHTELFPSLLSAEEAFFGIVDSLIQGYFLGTSPQTPKLLLYYYEINVLSIVLLEKSLKTKIYPC